MGAGNLRCSPFIITGLAQYSGERELSIWFYDADQNRLNLFDELARYAFGAASSTHDLQSRCSPAEVVENADLVVLQIGRNCAKASGHKDPQDAAEQAMVQAPPEAMVLNLSPLIQPFGEFAFTNHQWPDQLSDEQRHDRPHQLLRFLRDDEPLYQLFTMFDGTPVKRWLNNPLGSLVS